MFSFFRKSRRREKTATRVNRVKAAETDRINMKAARDRLQETTKRRKSTQDMLKELEKKQSEKAKKRNNASVKSLILQANLSISPSRLYLISAGLSVSRHWLLFFTTCRFSWRSASALLAFSVLPAGFYGFL